MKAQERRTSVAFNGDDTRLEGSWSPPSPEEQLAALQVVKRNAESDEEYERFAAMLGLTDVDDPVGS